MIDIVDDTNLYPPLFGIDWVIDNHTIINFKKIILSFEYSYLRVVAPIDPLEDHICVEPVNSEGQGDYLDHIYNITSPRDDYVNPTAGGKLSRRSISFCTSYFGEALKNW